MQHSQCGHSFLYVLHNISLFSGYNKKNVQSPEANALRNLIPLKMYLYNPDYVLDCSGVVSGKSCSLWK